MLLLWALRELGYEVALWFGNGYSEDNTTMPCASLTSLVSCSAASPCSLGVSHRRLAYLRASHVIDSACMAR